MRKSFAALVFFCILLSFTPHAFAQRAPAVAGGGGGAPPPPPDLDDPIPTDPGRHPSGDDNDNDINLEIQTEPQVFDCGGKQDGFFCGDKDQKEILFQCWNGSVTYSQKCPNGCDTQTGTCKPSPEAN